MNIRLTDIWLRLVLALILGAGMAACTDGAPIDGPEDPCYPSDEESAVFTVRITPVDAPLRNAVSRAGSDVTAPLETMNSLRIVILSGEVVEVNYSAQLGENTHEYFGIFKVRPGADKKIYAIANPEATGFPFDSYPVGSTGMEAALEGYSYTFDPARPIPMTDSRTIPALLVVKGQQTQLEMNVVRVATKFSIDITNRRNENLILTSFTLESLGMDHYLMPHFTGTDGKHIISDGGVKDFAADGASYAHWSDWLAMAVNESQASPEDETLADRRGWIMKYAVPSDATTDTYPIISEETRLPAAQKTQLPTAYFGETANLLAESTGFGGGAATGFEQGYTFSATFRNSKGDDIVFTDQKLPNLRALFRNTHAVVHIYLTQHSIEVDVIPYASVELKPDFGIIRDNETGWVIIDKYAPKRYYYDDKRHIYYDADKKEIATRVEQLSGVPGKEENSIFAVRDMKTNLLKYTYDYTAGEYYLDLACTDRITSPAQCTAFLPVVDDFLGHKGVIVLRYDEYGKGICMYDPNTGSAFNEIWSPLGGVPNYAIQKWENDLGYDGYMMIRMTDQRTPVFLYRLADDRYFRYTVHEDGSHTLDDVEAFPPKGS